MYAKMLAMQEQIDKLQSKVDLVLGGISLLLDKSSIAPATSSATTPSTAAHHSSLPPQPAPIPLQHFTSSFCTPPHRLGHPSHHVSSNNIDDLSHIPILPVPSFPFPAGASSAEFTPRIDMSLFLLGVDNYVGNAVSSTMKEQPHAVPYNDIDGFLNAEEKCNGGNDGVAGSDGGVDQGAVEHDLSKANLEATYISSDSSSSVDSSDHYDWNSDPEFIAFMNGVWHPDM